MEQTAPSQMIMGLEGKIAETGDDLDALLASYGPRIFRYALASLRDRDAADTITQDCFMNAYRARDRFRNDCSIQTWLMQIAVNLVRDHTRNRKLRFWRRTRNAPPVEELASRASDGGPSAEARLLLNEQVKAIWSEAAGLPEKQRSVFLLRFVEDMDILEIAAVTGMKEGTVKTHLFRALKSVRERMGANL